ncbi:MAG: hypothetical protein D6720_00605 [Gammaproteobacteria bacterium]|nr:MAG: hypothetical protein D6720_00605 [Gammaproteobacteria bacterium]
MQQIQIYLNDPMRGHLRSAGLVLMLIGVLGILLPEAITITLNLLIAGLFLVAGVVTAWLNWVDYRQSLVAWLKPFLLLLLGILLAVQPQILAAALGLLLMLYFFFDAYASISFGLSLRPMPGSGWAVANGVVSFFLGLVFLVGWPFSSMTLVGLLIGISLFLDGLTLFLVSRAAR